MWNENYNTSRFQIGKDCLNSEMKRQRFENKARILENNIISDDELLEEAHRRAEEQEKDRKYRGPLDAGPLLD